MARGGSRAAELGRRVVSALATLVFDPDLLRFVIVGHTPAYWPLLPLFTILIVGKKW
jgi:hypothetical protein